MKLLFLDIDGVLNCYNDHIGRMIEKKNKVEHGNYKDFSKGDFVSVEKLNLLKNIIIKTDCEVVGISSWFNSTRDIKSISEFLNINIVAKTKDTGGGKGRVLAIEGYITENNIEKYCVLDDQSAYYSESVTGSYHVRPERLGLTPELANKVVEISGED